MKKVYVCVRERQREREEKTRGGCYDKKSAPLLNIIHILLFVDQLPIPELN